MKNIFLTGILFLVLVVPSLSFAKYDVKGDTSGNINNYERGSYYSQENNAGGYNKATDEGSKLNLTLFSTVQTKYQLTPSELTGLKLKLEKGGSTVKLNDLDLKNVYTINTGKETIFIYDPKIEDGDPKKNTTDQMVLGVATEDERMYIYKNPPLKESKAANDSFNAIDQDRGLEPGSTLSRKNRSSVLEQEKVTAQKTYDKALIDKNAAQSELDNYNGGDVTKRAQLEQAVRDALLAEQKAGQAVRQAGYNETKNIVEQQKSAIPPTPPPKCSSTWTNPLPFLTDMQCLLEPIAYVTNIIFKLTSFIAYITGTLFDYSLELSINSAEFFKKLGVVEITWAFIRDILNMSFIFILLWTAVQILIGNEGKYNARKMLTNVIIVAILMNFSLFAAKLMVDGSNIVSLKIYEAMKSNTQSQNATISERVMNTVGLSTLYNITEIFKQDTKQAVGYCATNPGALITVSVMGSIFLIILCLALGLAAILFLVRLVNIIFLFIKSPLWVWGHVIPGNATMEKIKNEWWSEMKHVLIFPIAYLFWMLVAVIIFEKLGTVKKVAADGSTKNGASLLDLICNGPGAGGVGESISLVAIFAIVIIFMMKAIEYGVKHASDGGSGAIGGKFATGMANKFAGYQTALTKGLAQKAGNAAMVPVNYAGKKAVSASVGAAKVPLRAVTGGIGALKNKENRWEGFKDGYVNPSINTKESLRNVARSVTAATANSGIANFVGLPGMAAKLAARYDDPKNSAGETRKDADKRRSEKAVKDEELKYQAIDKAYKIETQKDWEKKNRGGTTDQYEEYINTMLKKRTDALLGSGIAEKRGKNGNLHLENLKAAAIKRYDEEVKDEHGVVTGTISKIRFSEHDMHNSMKEIMDHDDTASLIKDRKTKFTTLRNVKAKSRIKAVSEQIKSSSSKTRAKKTAEETTKNLESTISKLKKKVEKLPKEDVVKLASDNKTIYSGEGDNEKTIIELNKAINEYNASNSGSSPNQAVLDAAKRKIEKAKEDHIEFVDKQRSALVKKENDLNNHLSKIEKAEAEKEKNK